MAAPATNTILHVGHDVEMQRLVSAIVSSESSATVQMVSGEEALRKLIDKSEANLDLKPLLIIIDEESLSVTSSQLILAANSFPVPIPVIYLYSHWLGGRLFIWLRDILKVSLLVHKPINHKQFLKEIRTYLSAEQKARKNQIRIHSAIDKKPFAQSDKGDSFSSPIEEQIARTIAKLRKEIAVEWAELSSAAQAYEICPQSKENRKILTALAHKLRGTAGSLGLKQVSARAAEIEDWLNLFSPVAGLDFQIWWQAIKASLAAGESYLEVAESPQEERRFADSSSVPSLVLIGCHEEVADAIAESCEPVHIDVVAKSKVSRFIRKLKSPGSLLVIIDTDEMGEATALELVREIENNQKAKKLSILLLSKEDAQTDRAELFYAGISATLKKPIDPSRLRALIDHESDSSKRHTLLVGDGVNTRELFDQISNEGHSLELLSEPAHLIDTLEEVEPEAVILGSELQGFLAGDLAAVLSASTEWNGLQVINLNDIEDKEQLMPTLRRALDENKTKIDGPYTDRTGLLKSAVFQRRSEVCFQKAKASGGPFFLCTMTIEFSKSIPQANRLEARTILSRLLSRRFPLSSYRGRLDKEVLGLSTDHDDLLAINGSLKLLAAEFEKEFENRRSNPVNVHLRVAVATFPEDGQTWSSLLTKSRQKLNTGGLIITQDSYKV